MTLPISAAAWVASSPGGVGVSLIAWAHEASGAVATAIRAAEAANQYVEDFDFGRVTVLARALVQPRIAAGSIVFQAGIVAVPRPMRFGVFSAPHPGRIGGEF